MTPIPVCRNYRPTLNEHAQSEAVKWFDLSATTQRELLGALATIVRKALVQGEGKEVRDEREDRVNEAVGGGAGGESELSSVLTQPMMGHGCPPSERTLSR